MSENLYQLKFKVPLTIFTMVEVDGPYDKWGYVVSRSAEPDENVDILHLVRGTGNKNTLPPNVIPINTGGRSKWLEKITQ